MPWISEFGYAMKMAEMGKEMPIDAGTLHSYVDSVHSGVPSLDDLPDDVVLPDPRAGRLEGRNALDDFVAGSSRWLAERDAQVEWVASTVGDGRAVRELVTHLTINDGLVQLPMAVVAERGSDRAEFRSYYSQWPLTGNHTRRPPILEDAGVEPHGWPGRYHEALTAGTPRPSRRPSRMMATCGNRLVLNTSTEASSYFLSSRCSSAGRRHPTGTLRDHR